MNTDSDNPYGDIDLTSYLQTEGRRRAAELALKKDGAIDSSGQHPAASTPRHDSLPAQQDAIHKPAPAQEQRARPVRQAGSLTEVLQQMGITGGGRRARR